MRASFDGTDIPRGGLNEAQMKFLSSKEAVALVGVKLEDVPAHKRRKSAMSTSPSPGSEAGDLLPPSWEQLDGERRQSEAYDRRNLATPVQVERGLASEPITPDLGTPMGEAGDEVSQGNESVTESPPKTETQTVMESGSVKGTEPILESGPVKVVEPVK
jgi:hypothetical protein